MDLSVSREKEDYLLMFACLFIGLKQENRPMFSCGD
jgi:hypothetical protein